MFQPATNLISKPDDASSNTKDTFLQQAREARLARELGQKQEISATKLQAFFKSIHCRRQIKNELRDELDSIISDRIDDVYKQDKHSKNELALFDLIRKIIFHCDIKADKDILNKLIKLLALRLSRSCRGQTNIGQSSKDELNTKGAPSKDKIGDANDEKDKKSSFNVDNCKPFDVILIEKILSDQCDLKQILRLATYVTNLCIDKIIEVVDAKLSVGLERNELIGNCLKVINALINLDVVGNATEDTEKSWDTVEQFTNDLISETINKKKNILDFVSSMIVENKKFNSDVTNKLLVNFVQLFIKITDLNIQSCNKTNETKKWQDQSRELVENLKTFLTIPSIILLLEENTKDYLKLVNEKGIFLTTLSTLTYHFDLIRDDITSIQALCILANMIHLSSINEDILESCLIDFCNLMTGLLQLCKKNCAQNSITPHWNDLTTNNGIVNNNDNKSYGLKLKSTGPKDVSYNPILGWLERDKDIRLNKGQFMTQLGKLWSAKYLKILFADLIKTNENVNILGKSSTETRLINCDNNNQIQEQSSNGGQLKQDRIPVEEASTLIGSVNLFKRISRWKLILQEQNCDSLNDDLQVRKNSHNLQATATVKQQTSFLGYYGRPKFLGGSGASRCKLLTLEAQQIGAICQFLLEAIENLTMIRQDILTNICMHHYILLNLWTFIKSLGPNSGLQAYLELLPLAKRPSASSSARATSNKQQQQQSPNQVIGEFQILGLFCECASNLINVLDESELYELQKPFKHEDLLAISSFMNNFVYQVLSFNSVNNANSMELFGVQWNDTTALATKSEIITKLVRSPHKLLRDLYTRDCRRQFAPKEHWFIRELKVSSFLKDIEGKKLTAFKLLQMIPHIIPHKERVLIFRKFVSMDKLVARPSTLISIHRSRIVEDGYQQLARLAPDALKGLIRVKFINDFGLGEAGIDQDGVFKEFLEDTMKRVFDPELNLFKTTSEQCLYPSPTSCLHENYESLFNFVGKMLAKAIYEGIMVDVPFAPFFLRRLVGQPQNALYSPLDELPSLDSELFKSLSYIKHYEGDVSELALTFCIDQDFMGKIETHELEPGGRSTAVTRENRVRYIHLVADFHLRKQIARQTNAFIRGFQSIIEPGWLSMFSAQDLQKLISGDNMPIDLHDLRKNTKYSGGFHNNHRVVSWLWDILDKDFTPDEHKLFLKFTTSCSKSPLLGFSHLEPPFTIRCIEVSDDLDLGDTLGSLLRGFLAIRRSDPVDRLPTSSTCFNLLKLPNYQRRSTLKEKLRYAIHSNAGFELS